MPLQFTALATDAVQALTTGSPDANGRPAEHHVSDGDGNPCRHCLDDIATGEDLMVLAWRPFPALQPYAETGPILLHGSGCTRWNASHGLPPILRARERVLIRGYGHDDRIVGGTGAVVATDLLADAAELLLERPEIAYLHLRSASNSCYLCRIDRI